MDAHIVCEGRRMRRRSDAAFYGEMEERLSLFLLRKVLHNLSLS